MSTRFRRDFGRAAIIVRRQRVLECSILNRSPARDWTEGEVTDIPQRKKFLFTTEGCEKASREWQNCYLVNNFIV